MNLKIPETVKAILAGTTLGAIGSVMLSLTLEPEISEIRMGQYGAFIGLLSSATAVSLVVGSSRNNESEKSILNPNKHPQQSGNNPLLQELVRDAAENHLNSLQPGSSEYFSALELYGKMLSGENAPPPTNSKKSKTSHRNQGA